MAKTKILVEVEQQFVQLGWIAVEIDDAEAKQRGLTAKAVAEEKVNDLMEADEPLQTADPRIEWGKLVYVDFSFKTTGNGERSQ